MAFLRFYMAFILFINNFGRSLTITILPYYFLGDHPVWRDFSAIGIAISCFHYLSKIQLKLNPSDIPINTWTAFLSVHELGKILIIYYAT
ncbi:hypothetical protein [Legionella sp. W05-934-2]|uniref:hypothetical protein n=1 Tax=Legionella sp. W05-934-2 TaxID=1198649 RepID=UPI003462E605